MHNLFIHWLGCRGLQTHIFDKLCGEKFDLKESLVQVPSESIAQFDLIPFNLQSQRHQLLVLLSLLEHILALVLERRCRPLTRSRFLGGIDNS
jgi:hypothetical protein